MFGLKKKPTAATTTIIVKMISQHVMHTKSETEVWNLS
jgi:hypothetical protein